MPIHWTIDPEQKLFHEIWTGTITADQACAAVDEAVRDPRYVAGMRGLLDMRRARVSFTSEDLRQIFLKKREYGEVHTGWRWALLAETTEQVAVCALYVSLTDLTPVEISTFDDPAEAVEWLGVEVPELVGA